MSAQPSHQWTTIDIASYVAGSSEILWRKTREFSSMWLPQLRNRMEGSSVSTSDKVLQPSESLERFLLIVICCGQLGVECPTIYIEDYIRREC